MADDHGQSAAGTDSSKVKAPTSQANGTEETESSQHATWGFLSSGIIFAAIPSVLFLGTMFYEFGFALELGIPLKYISFDGQNMALVFITFVYGFFFWFVGFLLFVFVARLILNRTPSPGVQVVVFLLVLLVYTARTALSVSSGDQALYFLLASFGLALFFAFSAEVSAWLSARHRTGARGKALAHEYRLERHRARPSYIFSRSVGIGLAMIALLFAQGISDAKTDQGYAQILNGPDGFVGKDEVLVQLRVYGSQIVAAPLNPETLQIGEKVVVFSIDGTGAGLQTLPTNWKGPLVPPR